MSRFGLARCCLAALFWLAPCAAFAQTATSDGIRAIAAGDDVTAARVLQPLAEGAQDPDPLAQFFLAILSDTGKGVWGNPFQACALYLRAATRANPFMSQSLALAQAVQDATSIGPSAPPLCRVEVDDRIPPTQIRSGNSSPSPALDAGLAEGIEAFTRADYARAAEIFAPALTSLRPDHVAEFFLAAMYENGLGLPFDPMRACALYRRASFRSQGPLGLASYKLHFSIGQRMGLDAFEDCQMYSTLGFDHHFRPEMFWLEPGHSISLDLRNATIAYGGKETRIRLDLAEPGAVFLPLQHTELTIGPPPSTRRHFIEVFMWLPDTDKREWTLQWRLFEVIRDKMPLITGADLTKVRMPEPPAESEFDVRRFVELRVNDSGDAEWAVLSGAAERSDVIESDAERQAAADAARARKEADARMDWTRVADVHRNPSFVYPDVDGCGSVFVYGWSADRTEAITIRADKNLLRLSTAPSTFDLAISQGGLELMVHAYERPMRSWPFCSDMGMAEVPKDTWRMVGGTVTITLWPPAKRSPQSYRATIHITGAEFMSSSGARIRQGRPITLTAVVTGGVR